MLVIHMYIYNIVPALKILVWSLEVAACVVQLKGNLTHADRAHTTYWPKAHSYINPYWCVQKEKPAIIII